MKPNLNTSSLRGCFIAEVQQKNKSFTRKAFISIYDGYELTFEELLEKDGSFTNQTAWKVSKYGVFSDPYFPVFGLNTEIYSVNLRIRSEYMKIRTRKNSVFGYFSGSVIVTKLFVIQTICIQWNKLDMYSIIIYLSQTSFSDLFTQNSNFYNLHSKSDFVITQIRTVLKGSNSVGYYGPIIWSIEEIRRTDSLKKSK